MNTELPEHIIEKLIELGKSDKIDDPALSADFEQFRSFSQDITPSAKREKCRRTLSEKSRKL